MEEQQDKKIQNIKVLPALTCKQDTSIKDIAEKLKQEKDRRIFVIDEEEKLLGIITTTDLVYKGLVEDNVNLKASDIMEQNVKSIDTNEELGKALEIMDELKSFVCPLTNEGKLLGIVSYHDIVGYLFNEIKEE